MALPLSATRPRQSPQGTWGVSAATGALLLGFRRARESTAGAGDPAGQVQAGPCSVFYWWLQREAALGAFINTAATGPAVNTLRGGRQVVQKGTKLGAKGNAIEGVQLRSWIERTHKRCPSKISLKTGARERAAASAPRPRAQE